MERNGLQKRVTELPWAAIAADLEENGYARAGSLLTEEECATLISYAPVDSVFRSRVVMQRHNFGRGEYAYFCAPLPPIVSTLREALYEPLSPIANAWATALRRAERYPAALHTYLARCHASGQTKPTPLLLHYRAGDFNCLHRDLYGPLTFPLQATINLSRTGVDFTGGEMLLVENRARQQARGAALKPGQGELVLFAVNERPARGKRGIVRAAMRHGVSRIESGERYALGIIFHDAA